MQSGYGGVSEIQQFMVDSCPPSLFSISTPPPPNPTSTAADIHTAISASSQHHKFHPLLHTHPPPHHHHPPQPPPPQFSHFHPIPITQQLFQQTHQHHHHHQFQLFQQHPQLGLDQESGPENSSPPARMMGGGGGGGGPPFVSAAMNFKLGVNESSGGGGSRDGLNEDDGILQGGDDGSESRLHPWHREDDQSPNIKEPFWRPLDIDYINRNNKRPSKDKQPEISNTTKFSRTTKEQTIQSHHQHDATADATADSNYKLFSELEAIYKPGSFTISSSGGGGGGGGDNNNNNQTGSGSALTVDDNPILPATAPGPTIDHQPDHGSDTSNGGEAPPPMAKLHKGTSSGSGRRKRAKRKKQQQLSSITAFFETLVKQLMDHQEGLHRKFLEVMERRDQERTFREDAWRKQEAAKLSREATARAQERALTASREAAIVSFIEKITGESLNLPTKPQLPPDELHKDQDDIANYNPNSNALQPYIGGDSYNNNSNSNGGNSNSRSIQMNSSRWPKAEVQALIKVRSGLETRFQEPGLKGPLWEEVSATMGAMGYHRSAKRCKEKWENINKYFRKTKDSGKKRPQHSKTCPYFYQLDQLYSKSLNNHPPSAANPNVNEGRKLDNSELLDAIVVSTDNPSFKFPETGTTKRVVTEGGGREEGNDAINEEEEEDDDDSEEEGGEGEEGQGESQEQARIPEGFNQEQDHHHHLCH